MAKHVRVTFSNGETYEIPALKIGNNRGKYFADKDFGAQDITEAPDPQWTNVYRKERDYAIKHEDELIDWCENNMNWEDVEIDAVVIPSDSEIDKHEEWMSNDKTIVTHA
jgi:hypothetical protein